jgi:hypothetical protein
MMAFLSSYRFINKTINYKNVYIKNVYFQVIGMSHMEIIYSIQKSSLKYWKLLNFNLKLRLEE